MLSVSSPPGSISKYYNCRPNADLEWVDFPVDHGFMARMWFLFLIDFLLLVVQVCTKIQGITLVLVQSNGSITCSVLKRLLFVLFVWFTHLVTELGSCLVAQGNSRDVLVDVVEISRVFPEAIAWHATQLFNIQLQQSRDLMRFCKVSCIKAKVDFSIRLLEIPCLKESCHR